METYVNNLKPKFEMLSDTVKERVSSGYTTLVAHFESKLNLLSIITCITTLIILVILMIISIYFSDQNLYYSIIQYTSIGIFFTIIMSYFLLCRYNLPKHYS